MPTSAATDPGRNLIGPAAGWPRRAGFTLIEMTLALAVMGMIAALGLPFALGDRSPATARSKVREIATLLRIDRNAAIRLRRPLVVTVDRRSRTIFSERSGSRIVVPSGVSIDIVPRGAQGISFRPDGRSSGGVITLSAGSDRYGVEINPFTSLISLSGD